MSYVLSMIDTGSLVPECPYARYLLARFGRDCDFGHQSNHKITHESMYLPVDLPPQPASFAVDDLSRETDLLGDCPAAQG